MDSPFIHGRLALADAAELIERFGDDAGFEAAARAERSRDVGNVAAIDPGMPRANAIFASWSNDGSGQHQ